MRPLLLGGATTDRLSPAIVMLWSHLVRGIALGVIAALAGAGAVEMWHLYGLAAVIGTAGAFFGPASESILPQLLPTEHLPRGNALQGVGEQGSMVLGPMLGGLLTASLGPTAAIGFNAGTFFVAAMTVRSAPHRRVTHDNSTSRFGVIREIGHGLKFARESHEVRMVLIIISASTLSYSGMFSVGLPALAGSFSSNALALGTLISAWGVGQLLGTISAALTGLPSRWGLLIIGMTLVEAAAFGLLGVSPNVFVASAILVLVGYGVAYSADVALPTFIQTRTPQHLLGRISSVIYLPRVVLSPISIAVLGLILDQSIRWGFAAAAIPMLAAGIRLALDGGARRLSTGTPRPEAQAR